MSGRLVSQTFSFPGPTGQLRQSGLANPSKSNSPVPRECEIRPSAGIESELKLLMPLSARQRNRCSSLAIQTRIELAYFRPREARRVISQFLQTLPYLIVDDTSFSLAELGAGQVIRFNTSRQAPQLELHVSRKTSSEQRLSRQTVVITSKLARLLEQEPEPARRARLIIKYAGPFIINGKRFTSKEFASVRLREVRTGSTSQRFLDLKGRRYGSHYLNRAEVSLPLSQDTFQKLLKRSDGGFVRKSRSIQRGRLLVANGASIAAEVDILFAAGKKTAMGTPLGRRTLAARHGLFEFAVVEIELPKGVSPQLLLRALRDGAHTLSVLRGPVILLSFRSKRGWELLGMKRLAARGLDPSARELLETLLAPYSKKQRARQIPDRSQE